jgi:glycosyltransferase involved in cell wall biosynthesis
LLKISIITASYNNASWLEQTILAVKQQDYQHKEHVIIDGGSTDGTVEVLEKYAHCIKYVSEPDGGIYHALNKGIGLARGQIIGTLGAGDVFPNTQVLRQVAEVFVQKNTESVYGDIQMVKPDNPQKVVRYWKAGLYNRNNWLHGWMPPHLSFYLKKTAIEKYGAYNDSYRSAGDYEFMLRMLYRHGLSASYLPATLCTMLTGGTSSASVKNRLRANREDRHAWVANGLKPRWYTLYAKPLGKIRQWLITN